MKHLATTLAALAVAATMSVIPGVGATVSADTDPCADQQTALAAAQHAVAVEKSVVATDRTRLARAERVRAAAVRTLNRDRRLHRTAAAHRQVRMVRADNAVVSRLKAKRSRDLRVLSARNAAVRSAQTTLANCRAAQPTPPATPTPPTSSDALNQLLAALSGSSAAPTDLTTALDTIATQVASGSAPGAAQLSAVLGQVSAAIAGGTGTIDPSQLQTILGQLPSGVDPAAFQAALASAATEVQTDLAVPPTTEQGLVDEILTSLQDGFAGAGLTGLSNLLVQVQSYLDGLLAGLPGLPGLPGVPLPTP